MSISRSIATLLLQGMKLCLLADSDIGDPAQFVGGVNVGPLTPDPMKGDTIISPRQINLMLAPDAFTAGVGGVTDSDILVIVAFYDFLASESFNAATGINAYDRFKHIRKVLLKGSDANNQGKIVNPDDPTNVSPQIKYLNTEAPSFRTTVMGAVVTDQGGDGKISAIARCYAMLATYQTREDLTGVRA